MKRWFGQATRRVVCIGGSPSAGTTLLADLLDSVPGLGCDPELGFLCVPEAYTFDEEFRSKVRRREVFDVRGRYSAPRHFLNEKYLSLVGLDQAGLERLVGRANDLPDFVGRFAEHRARSRGKRIDILVEKTPLNINHIADFCTTFPEGLFIAVVRDPRSVVASLVRRGFSLVEATLTWLIQTHASMEAWRHSNAVVLRYENLIEDPFGITRDLVRRFGIEVSVEEISKNYSQNEFRASIPRVKSWTVQGFTGTVVQPEPYSTVLSEMNVGWIERQQLLSWRVGEPLCYVTSVAALAKRNGYEGWTIERVRFDKTRLHRIQAALTKSAFSLKNYVDVFTCTDPEACSFDGEDVRWGERFAKLGKSAVLGLDDAKSVVDPRTMLQIGDQLLLRSSGTHSDDPKTPTRW